MGNNRRHVRAALFAGAGLLFTACRVTDVSFADAETLGGEYFAVVANGDVPSMMRFYSSEFVAEDFRPRWEAFLRDRGEMFGTLTNHSLASKRFAPRVRGTDSGGSDVCFIMTYAVTYSSASTQETLTICPDPVADGLRIIGLEMQREDANAERLALGKVFHETGLAVTPDGF